ncbi:MAG: hypothetical protein WCD82_18230, partial [Xanthobacteraceae bacterium]
SAGVTKRTTGREAPSLCLDFAAARLDFAAARLGFAAARFGFADLDFVAFAIAHSPVCEPMM